MLRCAFTKYFALTDASKETDEPRSNRIGKGKERREFMALDSSPQPDRQKECEDREGTRCNGYAYDLHANQDRYFAHCEVASVSAGLSRGPWAIMSRSVGSAGVCRLLMNDGRPIQHGGPKGSLKRAANRLSVSRD